MRLRNRVRKLEYEIRLLKSWEDAARSDLSYAFKLIRGDIENLASLFDKISLLLEHLGVEYKPEEKKIVPARMVEVKDDSQRDR